MKYVFFGSPHFAAVVLGGLIRANESPVALVCNPDRPVGRKKVMTEPETKQVIKRRSEIGERRDGDAITIFQPEKLDENFIKELKALEPDIFVVAAYAKIIPQAVLDIPKLGTLGIHPSLLPKYRGASPIQSAILGGEKETGVTIYKMDAGMDSGEILAARVSPLAASDTYATLEEKLAKLGGELIVETLPKFVDGKIAPVPQDDSQATFTKKFKTQDGFVESADLASAEAGDSEKANTILEKLTR